MKLPRRNFLHLAAGTAALPAVSRIAWAQAYPARPVRIVAPTGPGRGAQSCPAWKVLQLATCPDRSPVMNQRVRCRKAARSFQRRSSTLSLRGNSSKRMIYPSADSSTVFTSIQIAPPT